MGPRGVLVSLSPKVLPDSPYVFLWTVDVWAFKTIYDPIPLNYAVLVLGGHEKGFYGVDPFEIYLDPQVVACPFEPIPWYVHGCKVPL